MNPTWLAYGDSSHTHQLVYVPPSEGDDTPDAAKLLLPARESKPQPRHRQPSKPKPAPQPVVANTDADAGDQNSKAGSALGTMLEGPVTGHEVHIAYSVVAPNPPIDRATLPHDIVGDVVIEVTIDSAGNVVATRIVQSIGHGIDEKIEATLRRWHYQPATLDGMPVASRTDVHFHFPS
jgi:TonB family protein